ncbi:ABC transporter permease [Christensenella timonensis]|uniref:ABC transporter permease n=1 Tax=Christensenella timonensis TaxID=1816678 RepID=UPI000833DA19|nr:ABC transporter permease [Christensenella timonensis]
MNEHSLEKEKNSLGKVLHKIPPVLWALVIAVVVLGIVSPSSIEGAHLLDFTRQAAPLIIVGIGQTLVMLIGGIDLSVGAMMSFTTVMASGLMMGHPENAGFGVLLCILIGIGVGLANGLFCAKLRMPPFVTTLGMSMLLFGVMMIMCNGAPSGKIPENLRFWATGFIAGIPSAFYVWILIAVVVMILIKLTPLGRYIFCTGANERAVNLAGLNVVKIKLIAYGLCGLLAALAGLVLAAYIGTGSLTVGDDYQMDSLTVAILGGAAFDGGKGSIVGTILASLFLMVLFSLIAVLNLDIAIRTMIKGIILVFGFLLNNLQGQRGRRRKKVKAAVNCAE